MSFIVTYKLAVCLNVGRKSIQVGVGDSCGHTRMGGNSIAATASDRLTVPLCEQISPSPCTRILNHS